MNRKILFISIFIFIIVLSIGAASAQDADDALASSDDDVVLQDSEPTASGEVSGGVVVETEVPWTTTGGEPAHGELSYDIPEDAKTIKSADVYVNIYGATYDDSNGVNANITIKTENGDTKYHESMCIASDKSPAVYTVNENVTKSCLDYMIHYNATSLLHGLNGTNVKIDVDTFNMAGKKFDGRIKLIALVLAYDDGDDDVIKYWINDNQIWTDSTANLTFDTTSLNVLDMSLRNIALSSSDGTYKLYDDFLTADEHVSGSYYQYNRWDLTTLYNSTRKTDILIYAGEGSYGGKNYKNALSVLTVKEGNLEASASIATERRGSGLDIVYAGTPNQITVTVNTNKAGKYLVQLLADGVVVNSTEVSLPAGSKAVTLIDPTEREVNASTVSTGSSGSYNIVNYTAKLYYGGELVNESSLYPSILYNGYLSKDLAYPGPDFESFNNFTITGDFVYLVSDEAYVSSMANRTDTWNVDLPADSSFVKAFVYVPYCYGGADTINLFNVTFNGVKPVAVSFKRDQANIPSTSGYGLIVYDVTELIRSGENTLILNKTHSAGAYPSTLLYLYNTTNSSVIKDVYIYNGADLVGMTDNKLNRPIHVDSVLNISSTDFNGAIAYIFGAGCMDNRASIVINGERDDNVWNTAKDANQINVYAKDISKTVKNSNNVSIILNEKMFTTLQQIIVTTKLVNVTGTVSIATERKGSGLDIVYAGTPNQITITVNPNKAGTYVVQLLADGVVVNSTEVSLPAGSKAVTLIDPTERDVNASTVSTGTSGSYNKVNYTARLLFKDGLVNESSLYPSILYNGYLSKDLAYPGPDFESFNNFTITGDFVYLVSDKDYVSSMANRTDTWNVNLPANSNFVKAFVYVPYCYGGADTINLFNVTFNSVKPVAVSFKRDQANIPSTSGYGLIVYDVTELIRSGENTLTLNKTHSAGAYPSTLFYLYNTTNSYVVKNVYIYNGADLVGMTDNKLNRPIHVDTVLNIGSTDFNSAMAYIFGAGSMENRSSIVINGERDDNVWNTAKDANQINVYAKDISKTVKNSNDVSIILNEKMFTALQQIIVTTKIIPIATKITAPSVTTIYNTNKNFVVTLKDAKGNAVANAKVTVVLNGAKKVLTTNSKGQATLAIPSNLVPKTYAVTISYAGDATHIKSSATSKVIVKKATVKLTAKKKTFKAKVKVKKYTVTLKNNKGKVMKKVKLFLKVKGKTYKATTNAKGKATFKITKLTKKGKYTAKVTYKATKYFNAKTVKVKITVKK